MTLITDQHIGLVIREQRQLKGWTIEQLATRIEYTRSHLSNIEAGRRTTKTTTIVAICHHLEIPVVDFMYFCGFWAALTKTQKTKGTK